MTSEHQAYDTHLNYIQCLCKLMQGATLEYTGSLKLGEIPHIGEKKNLIVLTEKSLSDEYEIVKIDQDYSYASTSWLPIKSYYLIFNILLTVEYLFKLQKDAFHSSHTSCVEEFTRKLKTKEIKFSESILNQVFDHSILTHTVKSGANLSGLTTQPDMYKMAIRKIARYKIEEWKQKNHINLRKKLHKEKFEHHLKSFNVSIFDFAYHMRIRSNYRDFAFIDGVTTDDTAQYFKFYYYFTIYFKDALDGLVDGMIALRTKSKIS